MKIIVVANQKGGVGKTTTSLSLVSFLKKDGYRVLLVDADPQGNASDTYGAQIEGAATLFDVLLEKPATPAAEAIQHCTMGDIIASDPLLLRADSELGDLDGLFRMKEAFEEAKLDYDYVVIDTAPALNRLLHNCLVAADYVVVPATPDRYAMQGLGQLHDTITTISKRFNPRLELIGVLLIKYDKRKNLSKAASEQLKSSAEKNLGTSVFGREIRECVKCGEAQARKEHLIDYAPDCTTAQDYAEFYRELIEKITKEG